MTINELRTVAMAAMHKAKAIKEEYGVNMTAEKLAEFNGHMAEFSANQVKYQAALATQESFAALDAAHESFNAPVNSEFPTGSPLNNAPADNTVRRNASKAAHAEAFQRYVKYGDRGITPAEQRAFISGVGTQELLDAGMPAEQWAHLGTVDTLGGFLAPEEFSSELLKDLAGASIMRQLARIRTTSRSVASFMTVAGSGNSQYSSGLTGSFRSEGWNQDGDAMPVQNQPRFGKERVPVHIWSPDVIEITMELLEDSGINLESEIRELLAETRRLDEDSAFILGNGVGMPTGISFEATAGNITPVVSGSATLLTYNGLVSLHYALPAQYRGNASYLMNSATYASMMQLADTQARPLFGVNEMIPNLFGRPIFISEFMPDVGANAFPIVFGDFKRGYGIADRMDLRIIRLNERYAPNVGLLAVARVGGQMLRNQPFVTQKIST